MNKKIKISVIGVTGYTGLELLRMAAAHPFIEIAHLVSRQGQPVALATLAPHLASLIDHDVQNVPLDTVAKDSDVVFLALPHTASQDIVIQPQHDLVQLGRAVVVHLDRPSAGNRLGLRVQVRLDRVVGLKLPVIRAGTPRKVTGARLEGAADRIRKRYVATDGSGES